MSLGAVSLLIAVALSNTTVVLVPPPPVPELTLDEALAALERQNLTLAQARARAEEARAAGGQASAQLLPSLSAGASYTRNSADAGLSIGPLPPIFPSGKNLVIQPLEQLSAQGTLRVPLVVPSAWYDVRAARASARAADASADAIRLQLRTGFAQAAHGARAAEEVVVASEQAVELAAEHARSAERRVKAGVSPPLDALRAKTELVRREGDLVRARADLDRARLALGILLGRDAPVRVAVADPVPPQVALASELTAGALARRPELLAQREQIAAAEQQVDATWARLAPQLSASGTVFASDVPYPTGDRDGWRATVDLTWPIFDGGLREARRRQARAQLATARAGAEAQRLAVVQEVADSTRDLDVARERLRLAETQRGLAADAAASARRSFEAGIASSLDVVDANDRLYQADVGLADARARLAQAVLGVDRAVGR
jgi:outer membrane protein TolC